VTEVLLSWRILDNIHFQHWELSSPSSPKGFSQHGSLAFQHEQHNCHVQDHFPNIAWTFSVSSSPLFLYLLPQTFHPHFKILHSYTLSCLAIHQPELFHQHFPLTSQTTCVKTSLSYSLSQQISTKQLLPFRHVSPGFMMFGFISMHWIYSSPLKCICQNAKSQWTELGRSLEFRLVFRTAHSTKHMLLWKLNQRMLMNC
jgi:hypothetical protein